MRKHLFVTLLLTCGMPLSGAFAAYASPEPQSQSQAVATITGTVLDENNEPVIGASVFQKGTPGNAAATDVDGHFTLRVAPGAKLTVSYVGYKTIDIAAANGMTVYLQPTTEMLNELVAVGYGSQKRANLTGAVATVDVARVMDSRPTADVTKALQGAVPGLTITTNSGDINEAASIKIRGTGTLSNGQVSNPLIVVDGVPVDDLSFVDPDDIAEISVLKDAASSAVYGTRAAFGVILINTKGSSTKDRVSVKYSNNFAWSQATMLPNYSTVPNQINALTQANLREGADNEIFGMQLSDLLPYAEAWYEQNGGQKAGYREMRPFQSWDDVGDYLILENGKGLYYADWDVQDIMFQNAAPSQRHNVSLEGTSGKTSYRLSFGYNEREGLMAWNPDKFQRYNANADIRTEIFSWLKAGARINFSDKEYKSANCREDTYTYMWRWGSYFGPYGYIRTEDGTPLDFRTIGSRVQAGEDKDVTTQTRIQAWMQAQICKGLSLYADFTYNLINRNNDYSLLPVTVWNNWDVITSPTTITGQSSTYTHSTNTKDDTWTMNVYGTYENGWNGHNIKIMAGATAEQEEYHLFNARSYVLFDNNLPQLNLTTGTQYADFGLTAGQSYVYKRATAGFFGRINYDYKGIYLLELNGRYDGSSRFPAKDQWAFFPSASVGYRFSEESYFEKAKEVVSNGKIRASYGEIGNEAIGSYMFLPTVSKIGTGSVYWLNDGAKISQLDTPSLVANSLTWETVATTDVGVDLGFFDNSLNLTFDWFQRDTRDMLAPSMELPAAVGAAAPYVNAGKLRTRGWELGLGWNHSFGDADIYVNASIYDGKTKVVEYNNPNGLISSFYNGATYGDIWGFETERYFEEYDFTGKDENGKWIYAPGVADQTGLEQGTFVYGPGDIKFKDLNGDGVINGGDPNMKDEDGNTISVGSVRNHGDLKVIGNSLPRYEYSFRVGGAYKGFDIDLYFQGVGKRDLWYTSAFVTPLARGNDATYDNQESYNKMIFDDNNNIIGYEIDQNNDYPCMFGAAQAAGNVSGLAQGRYNFYPQTKYLMNMAYLRFKTLTVGYTIPVELTRKAYIQKARIYFSADNLCLLYNGNRKYPIDPEIGTNWTTNSAYGNGTFGRTAPMMRSFSFGIQVTL